jgi:hypothetical protein
MSRSAMLAIVVVFLVGFAGMTVYAAIDRGFTILSVASLLIIGLLGVGVVGALLQPPDEDP